jgi:hypothetical protein
MPLFVTVTPGTTISNTTTLDATTLNLLGTPSVDVVGTVDGGSLSLSPGSVNTNELADGAVTFAKMQPVSASVLIGNDGSGTAIEQITPNTTNFEFGSGTFALKNQGVTYAKIQNVSATNRILGRKSALAGVVEEIELGTGLVISGGLLTTSKTTRTYTNTVAVPAYGAAVTPMNHSLGGIPSIFRVYVLLTSGTSAGYQAGDMVPIEAIVTAGSYQTFAAYSNDSQLGLVRSNLGVNWLANKSTGFATNIESDLNSGNWSLVFEAVRFT